MTASARHAALLLASFASTSCSSSPDRSSSPDALEAGVDAPDAGVDAPEAGVLDAATPQVPACDSANRCSGGLTCCSGACVDVSRDPANCGACSVVCASAQFCTGSACEDVAFAHICDTRAITVALDPFPEDDEAGATLGTALSGACGPSVTMQQSSQLQPGILAMDAGRPALGVGDMLVAAGGAYGQLAVGYMDTAGLTPVYLSTDGVTARMIDRATGTQLVIAQVSDLGPHHDLFFLELAVEPQSGTLCFFGAGVLAPGTLAAAYYGSTQVVPGRAGDAHSWYVVEWTDTNGDGAANAGDVFAVRASGP
jgi:hypothetical protein